MWNWYRFRNYIKLISQYLEHLLLFFLLCLVPVLPIADKSFKSLEGIVSEETLRAVEKMGFTVMTDIQAQSIPHMLSGK